MDGTRWTASNCFSMSRPVVNLFLGAMIGTGSTEPDKCASVTRKIGRKVFRVCWMSGHYRCYLADNGRPKVFKSVAAFICEQAAANVATRRGLGDPTTFLPLFSSLSLSLSLSALPFTLFAVLLFLLSFSSWLRGSVKCPRKERGERGKKKRDTSCYRGQQGSKSLDSMDREEKRCARTPHDRLTTFLNMIIAHCGGF